MANVTGSIKFGLSASLTPSSGFLSGHPLPIEETLQFAFRTAGALADQCNLVHAKTYSFAASTPQTIDLTTITDILGSTAAFARIRLMLGWLRGTTDGSSLVLGNAASNAWAAVWGATGTHKILPSTSVNHGTMILSAPGTTAYPVSGTSKSLLMTPSAHAFDFDLVLFGADA